MQCSIPVFEQLFPPDHDNIVQTLLFHLAEWQALTKLQLHTKDLLALLDLALRQLGAQMWKFQQITCAAFQAKELPKETAQRMRKELADLQSGHQKKAVRSKSLPKAFNIDTYKFHALGDYRKTICLFGTTDSYSTQIVSAHVIWRHSSLFDHAARVNEHTIWLKHFMVLQTRKQWRNNLQRQRGGKLMLGTSLIWKMCCLRSWEKLTAPSCRTMPWLTHQGGTISSVFPSFFWSTKMILQSR